LNCVAEYLPTLPKCNLKTYVKSAIIKPMRILLVEDDLGIASFVVKRLKEAGYVVEHVTDDPAGLDELLTEEFDAVIIDIMLPLLDGLSVIQTVRQQNVTTPVQPMVALLGESRRVGIKSGHRSAFTILLRRGYEGTSFGETSRIYELL
jgi:CheY-like chemotaxis protein